MSSVIKKFIGIIPCGEKMTEQTIDSWLFRGNHLCWLLADWLYVELVQDSQKPFGFLSSGRNGSTKLKKIWSEQHFLY